MIHFPIRGFRPKRNAKEKNVSLNEPAKGFNYACRECDFEVFESNQFVNIKIDFMYNKYPFAPYHFLLIPNRREVHNQFLDPEKDSKILEYLVSTANSSEDEVRFGYNSLGAHASVNHLHFHGFLTKGKMPIDKYLENENFYSIFKKVSFELKDT